MNRTHDTAAELAAQDTASRRLGRAGSLAKFGSKPDKSRGNGGAGKITFSAGKAAKAAIAGQSFVPLGLELLTSAAWATLSLAARRVLDLLLAEHLRHGGAQNGFLRLTWNDMTAAGISRGRITAALAELEDHGLLTITRGGFAGAGRNAPSSYQLTFLPARVIGATGQPIYVPPLNYWKSYKKPAGRGSKKSF